MLRIIKKPAVHTTAGFLLLMIYKKELNKFNSKTKNYIIKKKLNFYLISAANAAYRFLLSTAVISYFLFSSENAYSYSLLL